MEAAPLSAEVVGPEGGRQSTVPATVLMHAVGPASAGFRVDDFAGDPELEMFRGNTFLAENRDWNGARQVAALSANVGAYALPLHGSKDVFPLLTLPPAKDSAQATSMNHRGGSALIKVCKIRCPATLRRAAADRITPRIRSAHRAPSGGDENAPANPLRPRGRPPREVRQHHAYDRKLLSQPTARLRVKSSGVLIAPGGIPARRYGDPSSQHGARA